MEESDVDEELDVSDEDELDEVEDAVAEPLSEDDVDGASVEVAATDVVDVEPLVAVSVEVSVGDEVSEELEDPLEPLLPFPFGAIVTTQFFTSTTSAFPFASVVGVNVIVHVSVTSPCALLSEWQCQHPRTSMRESSRYARIRGCHGLHGLWSVECSIPPRETHSSNVMAMR